MATQKALVEIGKGFWNIRGHFKIMLGVIDVGKKQCH
jgi:hypothetical protein